MKVLFLDMDGVLNSRQTHRWEHPDDIDSRLIPHFVKVIKATDCKIVLSTAWRHSSELIETIKERFDKEGIGSERIVGQTPDFLDEPRGTEIVIYDDETAHPVMQKVTRILDGCGVSVSIIDPGGGDFSYRKYRIQRSLARREQGID